MSKRIAIIGTGISGLVSAYLLNQQKHDITVYEANDYIGGHTATIDVIHDHQSYAIDTGFIVFNEKTYPNFCKLLNKLNVAKQKSEMSFSFSSDKFNLEYNGHSLNSLFCNRLNIFKPRFLRFIADIVKFNQSAKAFLLSPSNISFGDFLKIKKYSQLFVESYALPMASAIWSSQPIKIYDIPAKFILGFYENHGLLNVADRPDWYVIKEGSRSYIPALTKAFTDKIRLNEKVLSVERVANGVSITTQQDNSVYDYVVIATHSDQALAMLKDPTDMERNILGAIHYADNDVVLHTDSRLLPRNCRARASWNYRDFDPLAKSQVTYYMNRLQNIVAPVAFCVSLNQTHLIDPHKILRQFSYAHPIFDDKSIHAQQQQAGLNTGPIFYCGAYWGFGFHEDGVKSAMDALTFFDVRL